MSERAAADPDRSTTSFDVLAASEQRFRGLYEGSGAGIAVTNLEGRFLDANPAYLRMLGYTLDELRSRDVTDVIHPDDAPSTSRDVDSLLSGEIPSFTEERRHRAKDGTTVWVRARVSLLRDMDGAPLQIVSTTEDVTAARQVDERLRRSESLRRLAGKLALVGGWSIEATDHTLYWSEEIFRILDTPEGEEPPLSEAVALYPPVDAERLSAAIATCFADGTPFDLELEITTYAGRRLPVRAIGEAQRAGDGRIERIIGAFQDISEVRTQSARTAELARRLSTTFESMGDGVVLLDHDWTMTYLNGRAEGLLHHSREDLLDRNLWEVFPEAVGTQVDDVYRRAVATGEPQTIEDYHFPPLGLWLEINAYPSDDGLALYFRDVTERHRAREALEQREATLQRQAQLLDEAQDAIVVLGLDHRITYWNRSAERLTGWSAAEALGADVRDLHGDDRDTYESAMAVLLERGAWTGELRQQDRTGAVHTMDTRWTLVHDASGAPLHVLSIATDVTEQRNIEHQLLRAQRMESLGTLAGGVAHDLNNVLAPILLAAELLQDESLTLDRGDLLRTIHTSAQRGADLVTQVLSFARGVEGRHAPIDVTALLHDIRSIVRDTFPKNVRFELTIADDVGPLHGDGTQIQQVLLNLAVNARDAMPDGGRLAIAASTTTLDEHYTATTLGATPGEYVVLEVEDEGGGMHPEVRDRVFEPFFTTKEPGSGTGLGLSTAAAIARGHGGLLQVYSEPGRGSIFRLYLPVAADHVAAQAMPNGDPDLPRGSGQTVLVVDDEAAVRAMTRQTLETYGYRVLEARDGAEAVSMFAQHRDRIDVVLTDMMMPIMDGPAAIHALKRLDPDVRIIGASGLHGNGKVAKASSSGVRHFLPKPYSSSRLLGTLADLLDDDG